MLFFTKLSQQKYAIIQTLAVISACLNNANAQTSTSQQTDTPPQNKVEISGHYANAIGTTDAASEGIVKAARINDLPILRAGEVLETVPGLVVTQHSGDGKANQYFLRGYNLDHGTDFASYLEGVPVNMPTNAHGQGYSDLNFMMPELVKDIAYYKGPYFAQNGDFSAAGSARINYVSSLEQGILDVTAGQYGYRRMVLANSTSLTSNKDTSAAPILLGALEMQQNKGPWTTPEDLHKINGLLKLTNGNYSNGWSMVAQGYDAHWNATDQVPLALIESGQLGRYSALDSSDGGKSSRLILSGQWHQHDADGYARANLFAQHEQLQLWSNFTFYELRPQTGDQFEQFERRNIVGGQIVKGFNHDLFGQISITEWGLQTRHDNIRVGLFNTDKRIVYQTVSDDKVSETESGLYLQNKTEWQPWLRTLVGARLDTIAMKLTALSTPQNSGTANATKWSPKFSIILGPWQKTEFFINYGAGFHSNDARGVIDKIDPTTGSTANAIPALVGARGKELGIKSDAIQGLQSSLALWGLNSDSELIYNADSGIGSTSANGASKRYGIEFNNHLTLNKYVQIDADLAWTHARYANNNDNGQVGNNIPNAVSKVGLIGVTLHNIGAWSGGLVTRYIGAYPLSQDGTLRAQSTLINNLRLQRAIDKNWHLTLDVLNLFNRQYYDIAYEQDYQITPTSPINPTGITVHPGEPRQMRLTAHYRF